MTVKELIEKLKQFPEDAIVFTYDNEYDDIDELTEAPIALKLSKLDQDKNNNYVVWSGPTVNGLTSHWRKYSLNKDKPLEGFPGVLL